MKTAILLGLYPLAISLVSGCATVQSSGGAISRSTVVLYNTAGRNITLVPTDSYHEVYKAHRREKRMSRIGQALLGDKRIPTRQAVGIPYGGHFRMPLVANKVSWAERRMTVKAWVIEKDRLIGHYYYCVTAPTYGSVDEPLEFGRDELAALRKGLHGETCGHQLRPYPY